MRIKLVLHLLLVMLGCSKEIPNIRVSDEPEPDIIDITYPFAFSGKILDSKSRQPIPRYGVDLLGMDSATNAVIDALGTQRGLFHISRNPTPSMYGTLPILITAPGYESSLEVVDLGADCRTRGCPGMKPAAFYLKSREAPASVAALPASLFSPSSIREISEEGSLSESTHYEKLSDTLVKSIANNKAEYSKIVVLLQPAASYTTIIHNLLATIRSKASNEKIVENSPSLEHRLSELSHKDPMLHYYLRHIGELFVYLMPLRRELEKSPPQSMGRVVASLLNPVELSSLGYFVSALEDKKKAQIAMPSLLPIPTAHFAPNPRSRCPYEGLIIAALKDSHFHSTAIKELSNQVKHQAFDVVALISGSLGSLIQALLGKGGPEITMALNTVVTGPDPISKIKEVVKSGKPVGNVAKLIPYLKPLAIKLEGKNGKALADFLGPLLKAKNPAKAISDLLTKNNHSHFADLAFSIFPTLPTVIQSYVPPKQLLIAQLLQGLIHQDFKEIRVLSDLKGSPAVLLQAFPKDILKLAQLPNVEKILAVE